MNTGQKKNRTVGLLALAALIILGLAVVNSISDPLGEVREFVATQRVKPLEGRMEPPNLVRDRIGFGAHPERQPLFLSDR